MVATTVIYFALVSVCLVSAQTPQCTTAQAGDISGTPVPVSDKYLAPPTALWDVPVENVCNNPGITVTVCDPNGPPPPSVRINNNYDITVQRNSNPITSPAVVKTIVYCHNTLWQQNGVKTIKPVPLFR